MKFLFIFVIFEVNPFGITYGKFIVCECGFNSADFNHGDSKFTPESPSFGALIWIPDFHNFTMCFYGGI